MELSLVSASAMFHALLVVYWRLPLLDEQQHLLVQPLNLERHKRQSKALSLRLAESLTHSPSLWLQRLALLRKLLVMW
jgi:hypothetical protein